MTTPVAIAPATEQPEGSRLRRGLAERGVIIMKENRVSGRIATTYGPPLEVAGQVLVVMRGSDRDISVGVKFEQGETSASIASAAFVDFDELAELLNAFGFLKTTLLQMSKESRDYTEVTYSTRDDVTVGFYQEGQKQQTFVRLGNSRAIFFGVPALSEIEDAVVRAKTHVESRRVAWEPRK